MVGFIVGMYDECCLWAQVVVLLMLGLYCTNWDMYMQVLYFGRALRTKETLPDFLKWRRVTRHPLVFRGLTGSQRTPGFWASQLLCLDRTSTDQVMREVNARVCGPHMGGHMLTRKIMRTGYFWLTMETDCCQFVQRCPEC